MSKTVDLPIPNSEAILAYEYPLSRISTTLNFFFRVRIFLLEADITLVKMPAMETGGSKTAAFAVWLVRMRKFFANCTVRYTESSG